MQTHIVYKHKQKFISIKSFLGKCSFHCGTFFWHILYVVLSVTIVIGYATYTPVYHYAFFPFSSCVLRCFIFLQLASSSATVWIPHVITIIWYPGFVLHRMSHMWCIWSQATKLSKIWNAWVCAIRKSTKTTKTVVSTSNMLKHDGSVSMFFHGQWL